MTEDVALPRAVTVIARGMSIVAGLLLLGVILLTVADVVSRNARDRSIVGIVDIATMLLVAIAFLGLASAEATGGTWWSSCSRAGSARGRDSCCR